MTIERVRGPRRRLGAALGAALLALAVPLAGCASGGNVGATTTTVTSGASPSAPAPTPSDWLSPSTTIPDGYRWVTGDHYKIAIPQAWEELKPQGTPAPSLFKIYVARPDAPASGPNVQVGAQTSPMSPEDSSFVTAKQQETLGATDVVRIHVTWPGATDAWLVDWSKPSANGSVLHRRQLFLSLDRVASFTLLATLPTGEFNASGLPQIMQTLQVTP